MVVGMALMAVMAWRGKGGIALTFVKSPTELGIVSDRSVPYGF
jgi:hypothetical protein